MRITKWKGAYRGFRIGYVCEGKRQFRAVWKSSMSSNWMQALSTCRTVGATKQHAEHCIDFQYRIEAEQMELGRYLTEAELRALLKECTG